MKPVKRNDELVSQGVSAGVIGIAALVGLPVGAACLLLAYNIYRSKRKY